MTTMAKAPYEQLAEEERRKYEVKMKEYNMNGGPAAKKPHVEPAPLSLDVKSSSGASPGSASTAATSYNSQPLQGSAPPILPLQQQQLPLSQGHQVASRAAQQSQEDDDEDDEDDDLDDDEEDGEYE